VSLLRDRDDENFQTVMMINPEILEASNETELESEGCLSVP
jgi:peptide deformylase